MGSKSNLVGSKNQGGHIGIGQLKLNGTKSEAHFSNEAGRDHVESYEFQLGTTRGWKV